MAGEATQTEPTTVTFLGTAAVVPEGGHDTASLLVNGRCLVDTGWYAAIKMRCYGYDPLDLDYLFLTHGHHDHYIGLPQILFYRSMRRHARPSVKPLKIVGPAEDLETIVGLALQFLQADRYPEAVCPVELLPLRPGQEIDELGLHVSACAARHAVPGLCYRFTDKRTGATLAVTGDTAPDPGLVAHVRGVHLLVTEASFGPHPAPAENESRHSGAPDAAQMARAAGVGRLALTHGAEEIQSAALDAARAIFPDTFWPADGETVTLP